MMHKTEEPMMWQAMTDVESKANEDIIQRMKQDHEVEWAR